MALRKNKQDIDNYYQSLLAKCAIFEADTILEEYSKELDEYRNTQPEIIK